MKAKDKKQMQKSLSRMRNMEKFNLIKNEKKKNVVVVNSSTFCAGCKTVTYQIKSNVGSTCSVCGHVN